LADLPETLTHLTWRTVKAIPLPKLPSNLAVLELSNNYRGNLGPLPQSLKSLTVHILCVKEAEYLPESLTYLLLYGGFIQPKLPWSASSSPSIIISGYLGNLENLPQSLVTQLVWYHKNPRSTRVFSAEPLQNFHALRHLTIQETNNTSHPIQSLPPALLELTFTESFNHPVDGLLPNSITTLTFSTCFNQSVNLLLSSLTKLRFGNDFNQRVDHLPPSLKYLYLGASFNQPINSLPAHLVELEVASNAFKQNIDNLPKRLRILIIYGSHDTTNLPPSLVYCRIGRTDVIGGASGAEEEILLDEDDCSYDSGND
jgi:hypothetical protein